MGALRTAASVLAACLLSAQALLAQTPAVSWTCVVPFEAGGGKDCAVESPSGAGSVRIVLRLLDASGGPVRNQQYTVSTNGPPTSFTYLDRNQRTDPRGEARIDWKGTVSSDVKLTFSVVGGGASRTVTIKKRSPKLAIRNPSPTKPQSWFVGKILPKPVSVEIVSAAQSGSVPLTDKAKCEAATVIFRAANKGEVVLDSVRGAMNEGSDRCLATTRWRLAVDRVGEQRLVARLGSDSEEFTSYGRALPRLVLALAAVRRRGAANLNVTTETFKVTRTLPDGTVLAHDSTLAVGAKLDRDDSQNEAVPVLAVDLPFWPTIHWIRLSVGASLQDIDDEFFLGISLLQPLWHIFGDSGLAVEDTGWDFHFVVSFRRDSRIEAAEICDSALSDIADQGLSGEAFASALSGIRGPSRPCATRTSARLDSFGVLVVADIGSVIGTLGKVLGF